MIDYTPNIKDKPLAIYFGNEICFKNGNIKYIDAKILQDLQVSMKNVFNYAPRFRDLSHLTDTEYDFIVTVGNMQLPIKEETNQYSADRIIHLQMHN